MSGSGTFTRTRTGETTLRRHIAALLIVAVAMTACTDEAKVSAPSTTMTTSALGMGATAQAFRPKAAAITDAWPKNDWKTIRSDFDATLLAAPQVSEAGLAAAWQQVVAKVGAYRSRREPVQIPKPGDVIVFDTPMEFERGPMKSRVAFHADGTVAGLFILVPDAP